MAENVSLKKLLARKDIRELIAQFEAVSANGYEIYPGEAEGAQPSQSALLHPCFPVKIYDQTLGWVAGEARGASFLAALLTFFAKEEYEKKALGRETLERYKEINVLYEIAAKLAATLDTADVAKLVLAETQRIICSDFIQVMILNGKTGQLDIAAASSADNSKAGRFFIDMGIARQVAFSGRAEIIDSVAADSRLRHRAQAGSLLYAPLKIQDRVIGVIGLNSHITAKYTSGDLKLLSAIALHAALAIENAKLYEQLREDFINTVRSLAEAIEKRDPYTGDHTRRVMEYSLAIGARLKLPPAQLKQLEMAAILHDIGKIGVRDSILLKPDRLTDVEFAEIKRHAGLGEEILRHIKPLVDILPGIKQHHERFDGKGYPEQIAGERIHLLARIIAVADAFDAMLTDRPYRKGLPFEKAMQELAANAGTQFDPKVVDAFMQVQVEKTEATRRKEGLL